MTHQSKLFGAFRYSSDQIITFPDGLLGFETFTQYVLRTTGGTQPLKWLLSVEESGPELALIKPSILAPSYDLDTIPIDAGVLDRLHAATANNLKLYSVVALPENIHHMSMNLRTPILINPANRLGLQLPAPGIQKQPIRRFIYRDLLHSQPEDKLSTVVTLRKVNETVNIGDEVSVQVLEFADGGVRLGINAPRRTKVSRGTMPVTPTNENIRANAQMDISNLKGIMSVYNVGSNALASAAAHTGQKAQEVAG